MSDARHRKLERRFQESNSVEDEAALLKERLRVGAVPPEALEASAYLGHPAALLALGRSPEPHGRFGRIEDVASMLGDAELTQWARACAGRTQSVIERLERLSDTEFLTSQIKRKCDALLRDLELTPNSVVTSALRLVTFVSRLDPEFLDSTSSHLLDLLLGDALTTEFAETWRERASKLQPIRIERWIASFGSGSHVRLDTEQGRDRYHDRLKAERAQGVSTFSDRLERLLPLISLQPYEPTLLVSEERIAALEARCGCPLPADYRAFLLRCGGRGTGPNPLLSPEEILSTIPVERDPSQPFPTHPIPVASGGAIPDGAIPVARGGHAGGVWTLLVTSGPDRGSVWTGVEDFLAQEDEHFRPVTRDDVQRKVLALHSLPLQEDGPAPERLSFTAWYGEWLALLLAALDPPTNQ